MTDRKNQKSRKPLGLVKREFTEMKKVTESYEDKQLEFIKTTIAPTLNQNELLLFIYRAQKLGLNPLEGEIFAHSSEVTVNGEKQRKIVMIVARDGKRRKASETGHLQSIKIEAIYIKVTKGEDGLDTAVIVKPWEQGKLWGAVCTIRRNDLPEDFTVTVPLSEYDKGYSTWAKIPETMIKKVAESQCLSLAFPELAGVYDESERFDGTSASKTSVIENGNNPAQDAQIKTIEALGGAVKEDITKQEAADLIRELSQKKGKKND